MSCRPIIALCCISLLSACASVQVASNPPERKTGVSPNVNEVTTASVGSTVLKQYDYLYKNAYVLDTSLSQQIGMGGKIVLERGMELLPAKIDGVPALVTTQKVYRDPLTGPQAPVFFVDSNSDGVFESGRYAPGGVYFTFNPSEPVRYSQTEKFDESPNSYSYELVFTGGSADSITLMYREYVGSLARPAFFQNVNYSLEAMPQIIKFKDAEIEISAVKNNAMTYRVLKGFR